MLMASRGWGAAPIWSGEGSSSASGGGGGGAGGAAPNRWGGGGGTRSTQGGGSVAGIRGGKGTGGLVAGVWEGLLHRHQGWGAQIWLGEGGPSPASLGWRLPPAKDWFF
ncbi:hypothetical protein TIFTF001_009641 [Ficus carica]|uniref:Uncharacterized protein n=1 Tax=Ficus carica TaxID=3494 RepID=A0AA88A782_FICCA|nr:hypothetical protein TIFTF001_009641 [Ficus carica]